MRSYQIVRYQAYAPTPLNRNRISKPLWLRLFYRASLIGALFVWGGYAAYFLIG
jgi:hypothetical protein